MKSGLCLEPALLLLLVVTGVVVVAVPVGVAVGTELLAVVVTYTVAVVFTIVALDGSLHAQRAEHVAPFRDEGDPAEAAMLLSLAQLQKAGAPSVDCKDPPSEQLS